MKKVEISDSVGKKLAHDVIEYGPKQKRVLFERGHQIQESDIEKMKDSGNYFVFISEGKEEGVHEDEAASRMAEASVGKNLTVLRPRKGRVRILSEVPGLLKAKTEVIKEVNLTEPFIFAFKGNNAGVRKREEVASAKIAPLVTEENKVKEIEELLERNKPVLEVVPPKVTKIGLIITGTEIYEGRIEDAFEPTLKEKLNKYGLEITKSTILPDEENKIKNKILEFHEKKYDLILVTGGMAVDSKDVTPSAIKKTGAEIISRGIPIFPGNMLMISKLGNSYILGLPACVLPDEKTSFDFILPRVLTKEKLTKEDIAGLGDGGLL